MLGSIVFGQSVIMEDGIKRALNRRTMLGLGVGAAAVAAAGTGTAVAMADEPDANSGEAVNRDIASAESAAAAATPIADSYQTHSETAGGKWNALISSIDADGSRIVAVEQDPEE